MAARTAALLIDDDARLGALMTDYLGKHGIDVTVAGDGKRGLAALRGGRFDVVLLDVMLPDVDGFETCRRIRSAPELAAIPVLMLTARGDDVDKVVGLELGADDYLAQSQGAPLHQDGSRRGLRARPGRRLTWPTSTRGSTCTRSASSSSSA